MMRRTCFVSSKIKSFESYLSNNQLVLIYDTVETRMQEVSGGGSAAAYGPVLTYWDAG